MQRVQQAMEAEYNDSQMSAVTAGLDRSPVILIQARSSTCSQGLSSASCIAVDPLDNALADFSMRSPPRGGAHALAVVQGPPGTGKTRTILGLLSIILHAAPAHSSALIKRAPAAPMPEYGTDDVCRLWRNAAPWLAGTADPRLGFLHHWIICLVCASLKACP